MDAVERALELLEVAELLDAGALDLLRDLLGLGRNSCSGGSSRRIVTGRPSIASKRPSKSSCWSGSSSASAARLLLGLGHDHRAHLGLAVRGHEHVLGPAEPDALGAELAGLGGVLGRVGVGAHAERRSSSAQPSTVSNWSDTSGSSSGTSSAVTTPALPSIAIRSPSHSFVPFTLTVFASRSMSSARAGHARLAHAARHERRVAGLAALAR